MNDLDLLVVSLDTAKKLKEAGFPQEEIIFTWAYTDDQPRDADGAPWGEYWHVTLEEYTRGMKDEYEEFEPLYPAPTVEELTRELPHGFKVDKRTTGFTAWRPPKYGAPENPPFKGQLGFDGVSMAEALALLWLKLNEEEQ